MTCPAGPAMNLGSMSQVCPSGSACRLDNAENRRQRTPRRPGPARPAGGRAARRVRGPVCGGGQARRRTRPSTASTPHHTQRRPSCLDPGHGAAIAMRPHGVRGLPSGLRRRLEKFTPDPKNNDSVGTLGASLRDSARLHIPPVRLVSVSEQDRVTARPPMRVDGCRELLRPPDTQRTG